MAEVPVNRTRVVPIMAARKSLVTPKPANHNNNAAAETRTEQPTRVTRSQNKLIADAESLRLECLDRLGLYAVPTKGDGNCLYYALSDQLFGEWAHSAQIRNDIAHHMRKNRDYFVQFTSAVGGQRRAPRRAASTAARSSSTPVPTSPSSHDRDEAFNAMVTRSHTDKTWGGSEELQAFCQFYKRDVNVYTEQGVQRFRDVNAPTNEERDIVHIAFHNFNHYSSVRNVDGPHDGPPCVKPMTGSIPDDRPVVIDVASPWKILCIREGLGGRYDHDTIVEMLRQCRGDIDRAFANLLDEESSLSSSASASSSQSSSTSSATSAGTLAKNPMALPAGFKPRLTSSRSSSRTSTASKRSANDDSEDEVRCSTGRRQRGREQKRRILPNVTVGINFGGQDRHDLVSLRLRVNPDTIVEQTAAAALSNDLASEPTDSPEDRPKGGRKLRSRNQLMKARLADVAAAPSVESAEAKVKVKEEEESG